jgi:putative component of membrane protein insertase Oxa1/YidC/SpoIIIJ protein YidD
MAWYSVYSIYLLLLVQTYQYFLGGHTGAVVDMAWCSVYSVYLLLLVQTCSVYLILLVQKYEY